MHPDSKQLIKLNRIHRALEGKYRAIQKESAALREHNSELLLAAIVAGILIILLFLGISVNCNG